MASPPRSNPDEPRSLPGIMIPLIVLSILLFAAVIMSGVLAFFDFGKNDDPPAPTVGVEGQALQQSGFTIEESRTEGTQRVIVVQVSATNTGDETLENQEMLVQCLDNGNVSGIARIDSIDPGQTRTYTIELRGTGEPQCTSPSVEFDDQRGEMND